MTLRTNRKSSVSPLYAIVVVLVAGTAIYILFGSGFDFPFNCDLKSDSVGAPPNTATCALNTETSSSKGLDNTLGGSQEVTDVTAPGDSLYSVLVDNLSDENTAVELARSFAATIQQSLEIPFDYNAPMPGGKRYSITVDRDGRLLQAALELDPANVFHAIQDENGLRCWKEEVVLDFKTESISINVAGTLTESVLNTGEGTELALKLSNLFRWDIDFHSESVRGDVCKVLFERRYADDRPSGYGQIL